jgi:hypothetical protein
MNKLPGHFAEGDGARGFEADEAGKNFNTETE